MNVRHIAAALSMLALTAFGSGAAYAYDRGVTVTTPGGTYTKTVDASCAGGICTRDAEVTGPNGGTVTRAGTCAGGRRFYHCASTVTGPAGNSITRHAVGRRRVW